MNDAMLYKCYFWATIVVMALNGIYHCNHKPVIASNGQYFLRYDDAHKDVLLTFPSEDNHVSWTVPIRTVEELLRNRDK